MEQLMPDRISGVVPGNNSVANKMNDLISNEARIGTVACTQACISRRVEDLHGGIMAQFLERIVRYLRKSD